MPLVALIRKVVFKKGQLYITLILFSALFMTSSFYIFIKTFERNFFNELKSIYPNVYIFYDKKMPLLPQGMTASREIFDTNWGEFLFSLNDFDKEGVAIQKSALRTFDIHHKPAIVEKLTKNGSRQIFVSKSVFTKLMKNKDFKGYMLLRSASGKNVKFTVEPVSIPDDLNWFIISHDDAKNIFSNHHFDKVVFYSNLDESSISTTLKEHISQPIHFWHEHIILINRAIKDIMLLLFSIITLVISFISFFGISILAQNIIDDIKKLTYFAFLFGYSRVKLFAIYFFLQNTYLLLIITSIYIFSILFMKRVTLNLWNTLPSDYDLLSLLSVVGLVSLYIVYTYTSRMTKSSSQRHNCA